MNREPSERIWPYTLLVICLLVSSIIAPGYWNWHHEPAGTQPPSKTRRTELSIIEQQVPCEQQLPDEQRLPREPFLPSDIRLSHDHRLPPSVMDGSPRVQPVLRATAGIIPQRQQPLPRFDPWEDAIASGELDPASPNANDGTDSVAVEEVAGHAADIGPLFANKVDLGTVDEVLPPAMPADGLDRDMMLARADLQLAWRDFDKRLYSGRQAMTVWPRPQALIDQLQDIAGDRQSELWAQSALAELARLAEVESIDSELSRELLDRLEALAKNVRLFVLDIKPIETQANVLAAAEALHRRVIAWQQVQTIVSRGDGDLASLGGFRHVNSISLEQIESSIRRATHSLPGTKAPKAWREYLRLDQLRQAIVGGKTDPPELAALARNVLEHLHSPRLDRAQLELLNNPAFERLEQSLRQLATEPVAVLEVIYAMEQYELTRETTDARRLASRAARFRWSQDEEVAELIRRIDANYRAKNARCAITDDMLNRLLPKAQSKSEVIDEYILSSYVAGQRVVKQQLKLKLIPDNDEWRMGLEARGTVTSDTNSFADGARLATQGEGEFHARKLFVVDRHHIHVWPARATASYQGQLYSVSTNYDSLPIISRVARNMAIEQYSQQQWAAHQEVESRIKQQAATILDKQSQIPLVSAEAQLNRQLLTPLSKTSIDPTPMRLYTSDERIVGHYRLANLQQLGGHTPRPWAPKHCLMSLQIHESAINNVIDGLKLDGREDNVRNLYKEIYGVFGIADVPIPESLPQGMKVRFADENAVHVRLHNGRMEVTLRLAELSTQRDVWRDLVIRNDYTPDLTSLDAKLLREGSVRLKGKRLGIRDQVALRGIFTKMFGDNREVVIIPSEIADNPGLVGTAITQYVIRDGWLSVAIGLKGHAVVTHRPMHDRSEREARAMDVVSE